VNPNTKPVVLLAIWAAIVAAAVTATAAGSPTAAARAPSAATLAAPSPSANPTSSSADSTTLEIEALVAEALAGAPSVSALRARVAAANAAVGPASSLPDPMVEAMLQNVGVRGLTVGSAEMSMAGVEVRQPLLWPGKRRARRAAAEAETRIAGAELASGQREVAARIRSIGADLYAVDREQRALAAGGELLGMLAATVSTRYGAGQADQEAVLKQRVALARVQERLDDLAAERRTMMAELAGLLGRRPGELSGRVAVLPAVASPAGSWEDLAAAASPNVAVKRATVASAEQRLTLARLESRPNAFVGGAYGYRGDLDPVVTVRLGLELPLWNRGRLAPLRRVAEYEVESARQELRAAEAEARAQAAQLQARWDAAEQQIARYQNAILPQTADALDAARAGYLAGRGDFSTVIEDFNAWLDARAQLARREADRYGTWASLQALAAEAPVNPAAAAGQGGGS
jgi:outer membrane protein TolC